MIIPFYIKLFLLTLSICVWQPQSQVSSSENNIRRHGCGRKLSDYETSEYDTSRYETSEYETSNYGSDFTDEPSSTINSNEEDNILSDSNEEDEGYLQQYLSSRIHRERLHRTRREFYDFVGSLDSVDSLGSRRKLAKKIVSHLRKHETFDYDELMDYIDTHLEGEQKEKMKLLVEELKEYRVKYLLMKSRFKNNAKELRKQMKKKFMFMILLGASIITLALLLSIITSMPIVSASAVAATPVVSHTSVVFYGPLCHTMHVPFYLVYV
ncbi:hypothetical protein C922_05045 [Plasmodium inui San Antonio 1]|uniref:Plasmodium RESA N-terminal domain-containing protein n=1 Tax=Plasmodium inui San Antonio 1 TaxID=1237626 RepID=W7A680_9APIC|nr:hypothetical protein C922_05045 [Plasmodium inui San Antonio 1]EUD64574.1 hypothetical protein C922_05045 [Plasmodium inui San Antonio 1]